MEKKHISREGFSLIEVIIAVAILAILSVPILLYFTNSAVYTYNGKHEQAADIAAQTIVEEIDSVKSFDNIENDLVNIGRDWAVVGDKAASPVASDDTGKTVMTRPVSVNGYDYIAKVTFDYGAYGAALVDPLATTPPTPTMDPDDPDATEPPVVTVAPSILFNSYQNPHFQNIYSDESLVLSEGSDVFDIGIGNLYYELNGVSPASAGTEGAVHGATGEKVSLDSIKTKVKRTLRLSISNYSSDTYTIKGICDFSVASGAFGTDSGGLPIPTAPLTTSVTLDSKRVTKGKIKNIYFLFLSKFGTEEEAGGIVSQNVIIDSSALYDSSDPMNPVNYADDMKYYFIVQSGYNDEGIQDTSKKFRLTVTDYNPTTETKYFNNDLVELSGVLSSGLVETSQDKRIAAVTVEIFKKDEEGNISGEPLATNTTTKSV